MHARTPANLFKVDVRCGRRRWVNGCELRPKEKKEKLLVFCYTVYITVIESNLVIFYCLMCTTSPPTDFFRLFDFLTVTHPPSNISQNHKSISVIQGVSLDASI